MKLDTMIYHPRNDTEFRCPAMLKPRPRFRTPVSFASGGCMGSPSKAWFFCSTEVGRFMRLLRSYPLLLCSVNGSLRLDSRVVRLIFSRLVSRTRAHLSSSSSPLVFFQLAFECMLLLPPSTCSDRSRCVLALGTRRLLITFPECPAGTRLDRMFILLSYKSSPDFSFFFSCTLLKVERSRGLIESVGDLSSWASLDLLSL